MGGNRDGEVGRHSSMGKPDQRRWADAAAVVAVVVTLILAARQLRPIAEVVAFLARTGETVIVVPATTWPRAAVWIAVGIPVLARWRAAAVLGAWAAVLFEIVVAALRIDDQPGYRVPLDLLVWPILPAVLAAVLLSVPAPAGRGLDLLGRPGRRLLAAAAAVTTLTAMAIPLLGEYYGPPPAGTDDPGFNISFAVSTRLANAVAVLTLVLVLGLALAAGIGADRAVRGRALTLIGAGAAGFAAIQFGLPRPFGVWDAPLVSGLGQAVLAATGPVLLLGAGWLWTRFGERRLQQT